MLRVPPQIRRIFRDSSTAESDHHRERVREGLGQPILESLSPAPGVPAGLSEDIEAGHGAAEISPDDRAVRRHLACRPPKHRPLHNVPMRKEVEILEVAPPRVRRASLKHRHQFLGVELKQLSGGAPGLLPEAPQGEVTRASDITFRRPRQRSTRNAARSAASAFGNRRASSRSAAGVASGRRSHRRSASTARSSPYRWRKRNASTTPRFGL